MHKVTVKLFASLAETEGWRERVCEVENGVTAAALWTLATGHPALPPRMLCAINMEYRPLETVLGGGDEVAFFPPVTGG